MSSQVIYARVPSAIKQATDAYASERGKTLTGAVADLLDRGLSAVSDEQSVRELSASLASLTTEKATIDAELQVAKAQLAALLPLAQRAGRPLGSCPQCSKPITGYDLLSAGECSSCHETLSNLIVSEQTAPTVDQRELMILVGALGAVLAVAYLSSKSKE